MSTKLKHRWSVGSNYLAGITAGDWLQLLGENHFAVAPAYWHRAAFITLASVMNSYFRRQEEDKYAAAVADTEIEPPLIILGHWRSGTTHLHNLLACDPQFAFANTYQVTNPHTFLTTEENHSRRFAWMLPKTRPMDAVALDFQAPQEDELATCLMSLRSPYLGTSFPQYEDHYSHYLTFSQVPLGEREAWKAALIGFLKKLTFKYRRPLILKSPPHTARIRLLLEMFPGARFVHIHRHPYEVFQSCRHFYDTATWHSYLQRPDAEKIDSRIIARYRQLHDAFFAERDLIPSGQFHEMSFIDLETNPTATLRSMYEKLGLSGFEKFQPPLLEYINSLDGYRRNEFPPLPASVCKQLGTEWQRSFSEWDYRL